jgi:Raf kinase inhibitor-like YbhB/YbcL family protein
MIQQPIPLSKELKTLEVTSEAFNDRTYIPTQYTCDGENINPPLNVQNIPPHTKSLVLVVDDPDALSGIWIHWIVWNILPASKIKENSVPGIQGVNDFRKENYGGPCPSSGTHKYFFKVYALNDFIDLKQPATFSDLEKVMGPHVIGFGELIGLYKRAM